MGLNSNQFIFSRQDFKGHLKFNGIRKMKIMETVREGAPTLKGTFQDRAFPREERNHINLTLEPYARFLRGYFRGMFDLGTSWGTKRGRNSEKES